MSDLKAKFEAAMANSKTLTERPGNATLLKLYALYKQGSAGDVEGKRPGFTDMVGRAKYDAWAELKGLAANDAMQQYIDLVAQLKKRLSCSRVILRRENSRRRICALLSRSSA